MENNNNYEEFIGRVKGLTVEFDDPKLFSQIQNRIGRQSRRLRLAISGSLAILMLGFVIYYNFFPYSIKPESMADYLSQPNDLNGNLVISYVFSD